jgi:hypothetical protein
MKRNLSIRVLAKYTVSMGDKDVPYVFFPE